MALAQQLAELALANSQGLLNSSDDEYRLLRQNLFEQYSNSALVPIEAPPLPVARPGEKSSPPLPRVRIVETPAESRKPTLRRKGSFTASVTTWLKRGSDKASASYPPEPPSAPPMKRGFIPRLQRKASELFFSGDKRPASSAVTYSSTSLQDSSYTRHPPNTPLRSQIRTAIPTFPSAHPGTSNSSEIFDERNLYTAKDIRAAIIATEAEAQRIHDAFDGLESSTSFRVTQQNAHRLRAATPEHVIALMDGSNWRTYKPPKSPQLEGKHRPVPPSIDTTTDNTSVRSISSSIKRSLSHSKSISSLNPSSPLSARFPPSASSPPPSILRKNSASSIPSQVRLGVSSNTSLSRSTGHLPLDMVAEGKDATHPSRPGTANTDNTDTNRHPEVSEIQRRRDEVMARYVARLEFLQVRLKSAELHEKLLRR
ncbi:hypothetical protein C0991_004620 [Blastosporella zonata]|nr:hypothetical protein C0991_004620 [Blastosporella zonata]